MKRFGLRAVLFAAAVLAALPSNVKAVDDAVDDRVKDRLGVIYGSGYTLTAVDPLADNMWVDIMNPNRLRVINADSATTVNDNTRASSIGFFDPASGTFRQLVSAGMTSSGDLYSYSPDPSINPITASNNNTIQNGAISSTYTLNNNSGANALPQSPFEFGILANLNLTGGTVIGDTPIEIAGGGDVNNNPNKFELGSNDTRRQYRAYRLTSNVAYDSLRPDIRPETNAYVLAFYNYNNNLSEGQIGLTTSWDDNIAGGGVGGLTAFIITGVVNPEPGSMVLLATGLVGVIGYRVRRTRKATNLNVA